MTQSIHSISTMVNAIEHKIDSNLNINAFKIDELYKNINDNHNNNNNTETKHIDIRELPATIELKESNETSPHIVVNKLDVTASPIPFTLEENVEMSTSSFTDIQPTSVNKPKKTKQSRSVSAEDGENIENLEDFNGDYSKLNVTQLRKLVVDRGLSSHAKKLKKNELLQLLGGGGVVLSVIELDAVDM